MLRRVLGGVLAAALVVAACGDADEPSDATTTSSTTTADPAAWCDELDGLQEPADLTQEVIDSAPYEVQAPLQWLHDSAEVEVEAAPAGTVERLFAAQASVEAWGHEHCGGDHPFCTLSITFIGAIAGSALAGVDEEDALAGLMELVEEMDSVLAEHAPPEVRDDLDTLMAAVGTELSDEDEREAEAAEDALHAWADENCEDTAADEP